MSRDITHYSFFKKLTFFPFVEAIWLFGSRARGDEAERSDIDLAIVAPHASRSDWVDLKTVIDEADTLLKIDCIHYDNLKATNPLKMEIDRDKKILYEKKHE